MVKEGGVYSNRSDNPLADYWHVIVPYCSSDTWAGTGRSLETGYYFHGKHVFRSLTLHGPALTVIAGTSSTASVTTTTSSQPRTSSCQGQSTAMRLSNDLTECVVTLTVQAAVLAGLVSGLTVTTWLTGCSVSAPP